MCMLSIVGSDEWPHFGRHADVCQPGCSAGSQSSPRTAPNPSVRGTQPGISSPRVGEASCPPSPLPVRGSPSWEILTLPVGHPDIRLAGIRPRPDTLKLARTSPGEYFIGPWNMRHLAHICNICLSSILADICSGCPTFWHPVNLTLMLSLLEIWFLFFGHFVYLLLTNQYPRQYQLIRDLIKLFQELFNVTFAVCTKDPQPSWQISSPTPRSSTNIFYY